MTSKNCFILYTEYHEQLDMLTDAQAGQLMKAIFAYAAGSESEVSDPLVAMLWSIMKRRMDIDSEKYQKQCETKRSNGAKGGRPSKNSEKEEVKESKIESAKANETETEMHESEKPKETEEENDTVKEVCNNSEKPIGYFGNLTKHDTCNMIRDTETDTCNMIRDTETDTCNMIHDTEKEKKKNNKKTTGDVDVGSIVSNDKARYRLGEWY